MATRVLTFSTVFPSYHPRKGESTFFIEKIWSGLLKIDSSWYGQFLPGFDITAKNKSYMEYQKFEPKYHTIRAGHRWKVGDDIDARIWSGKPYRTKQQKPFGDDLVIPVERVWNFYRDEYKWIPPGDTSLKTIAMNDGLTIVDFLDWFQLNPSKPFDGQIISWNPALRYLDSDPIPKELPPINPNRKIIKL